MFPGDERWYISGSLKEFDQRQFMDTDLAELSGLTEWGFIYEPSLCPMKYLDDDCEVFWD